MLQRAETKNWERGTGKNQNLSYPKMKAAVNLKHPRMVINGKNVKIPICIPTGGLLTAFEDKR